MLRWQKTQVHSLALMAGAPNCLKLQGDLTPLASRSICIHVHIKLIKIIFKKSTLKNDKPDLN